MHVGIDANGNRAVVYFAGELPGCPWLVRLFRTIDPFGSNRERRENILPIKIRARLAARPDSIPNNTKGPVPCLPTILPYLPPAVKNDYPARNPYELG